MAKGTTQKVAQKASDDDARDVVTVLLDLLRRAEREVKLTPELEGEALEAAERYGQISFDLAVRQFSG